jgi:transposase-like protein
MYYVIIYFFLEQKIFFGRDIMMALVQVFCPDCGSKKVVRRGKSADGKQRYLCRNGECDTKSFMSEYKYNGRKSEGRKKIIGRFCTGSDD